MGTSILLVVVCVFLGVWTIYCVLSLAPWFPTRKHDMMRIGRLAHFRSGDVFCDIGSGDGRVVATLAKHHPQVLFIGIEMSFVLHAIASLRKKILGLSNIRLIRGDVYTQGYSDVDVLYVFGTQGTLNGAVKDKIIPLLPSGARILSYNFHLEHWDGEIEKDQPENTTAIYTYIKNT